MKRTYISKYLQLIVVLFFTYTCTEEVKNPCNENRNITLTVKGQSITACNGVFDTTAAPNAQILMLQRNGQDQTVDTIVAEVTDAYGRLIYEIPNSGCGINNVKFIAKYNASIFEDSLDFMCCDTTFAFNFQRACDEVIETNVTCSKLDTAININLSSINQGCIPVGAKEVDIRYNSFSISSTERIKIDAKPILALSGRFYGNISPTPDTSGFIVLGSGITQLSASFYVNTTNPGSYDSTLTLQTTCLGTNQNGTITLKLHADICDDGCSCPFSKSGLTNFRIDQTWNTVAVGETQAFNNLQVFRITPGMLLDGCYMKITSLKRFPDGTSATTIAAASESFQDWTITSPQIFPMQLNSNDEFRISATFKPESSAISSDTFEVSTEIYNRVNTLKDQCTFKIIVSGSGCAQVTPNIRLLSSASAELLSNSTGSKLRTLYFGDELELGKEGVIKQKMTSILKSTCANIPTENEVLAYSVGLPLNSTVVSCSGYYLDTLLVDDGQPNDKRFFSLYGVSSISGVSPSAIAVSFTSPQIIDHLSSGHGSTYKCKVIIRAINDITGEVISSQDIKIEAEVHENKIHISEPKMMKAFSQISDKELKPSYQAYKIWEFDQTYKYYGKVDNLNPTLGSVDLTKSPPMPTTDHSFFFEVDQPSNTNLRQIPKLYLVNNIRNMYSQITTYPVAKYNSNTDFSTDMENLVSRIFNKSGFTSLNTTPIRNFTFATTSTNIEWLPSTKSSDMTSLGSGINLELGGVYIVWNPSGYKYENLSIGGSTYSNYCEVAFVYIDGISDGSGTNHNLGYVSFYVAYPLSMIKN